MNNNHIIGYDALINSMNKCKNGVIWKDSVASFVLRGLERVSKLYKDLTNSTYTPAKIKTFKVTKPKERDIAAISFRDRVYQRSLNDNDIYPTMTKSFIYDNYACQINKGTDNARNRLKHFMYSYFIRYGVIGYVAQFDIKGYYPNMRHDKVEEMFKFKLSEDSFNRVIDILKYQYPGDIGYNPGSQLVQIAGISFLDKLDHYIKEKLHIKYYIRYMDDFILIHRDKNYLIKCFHLIEEEINKQGLNLNPKKSKIYHLSCGIPFLGFIFRLTNSGKVLMLLNPENIKNKRRELRRFVQKAKNNNIERKYVDASYRGWRQHAEKGNTYQLLQKMDKYYNNLWKGD